MSSMSSVCFPLFLQMHMFRIIIFINRKINFYCFCARCSSILLFISFHFILQLFAGLFSGNLFDQKSYCFIFMHFRVKFNSCYVFVSVSDLWCLWSELTRPLKTVYKVTYCHVTHFEQPYFQSLSQDLHSFLEFMMNKTHIKLYRILSKNKHDNIDQRQVKNLAE